MNYEQKYLIYKQKYIDLKKLKGNGGLFNGLFSVDPTAYTEYKDQESSIYNKKVEEIKINDVDVKIDSFILRKHDGYEGDNNNIHYIYNNYKIIVLSLSNKATKKNYIPFYKFEVSIDAEINENKLYVSYFEKLPSVTLEKYKLVVQNYLERIKAELQPQIKTKIEELSRRIQELEDKKKPEEQMKIMKEKEELKEKEKQKILSKIELQIQELEKEKIIKISESDNNINAKFKYHLSDFKYDLENLKIKKEYYEKLLLTK
jgi:hypothetical protein